jgi:hypothetical protein
VRIDRRVNLRDVSAPFPLALAYSFASVDLPAATVRDPTEFLDINIDKFARPVSVYPADHPTGRAVHPRQAVHTVTAQNRVHRDAGSPTSGARRAGPCSGFCVARALGLQVLLVVGVGTNVVVRIDRRGLRVLRFAIGSTTCEPLGG